MEVAQKFFSNFPSTSVGGALLSHYLSIVAGVALLVALHFALRRKRFADLVNQLPGPPRISTFFGHLPIVSYAKKQGCDAGEATFQGMMSATVLPPFNAIGLWKSWLGPFAVVTLTSPESVEPILNSNVIITKSNQYDFLHAWLGTGLLTSTGEKWRRRRKMLTTTFHFRILEDFVPIMIEQTKTFIDVLTSKAKSNGNVIDDLSQHYLMCALDIICETAMGIKIDAQRNPDTDYVKAIHHTGLLLMDRITKPWLIFDFMYGLTPEGRTCNRYLKKLHSFTDSVIKVRKEEIIVETSDSNATEDSLGRKRRLAFMDTLIHHHLEDPKSLSEVEIREEVDTFMFEGHDTTAWGLSWASYLVGLHPEVQEKIHDEIDSIFGDDKTRDFTMCDLREMKYIECVIKESLRLYPSVPLMARSITEDTSLLGYTIPNGMTAIIFTYMVHRDARHWPDPERFIPERFLPENSHGRHPFAYIPFSAGPRNCIGQKFALFEEKALLATLFRHFKVTSLDARDKIRVTPAMILKGKSPIRVQLEPRT